MIITTYGFKGQITSKDLENFIVDEQNFYQRDCCARFELKGLNIEVGVSDFNPFTDQDQVPTLLSFSKRYTYGTKELRNKDGELINIIDEFDDLDEVESWLEKNDYIYAPFEKYEHTYFNFRLLADKYSNLHCRFDSSIGGYLVMKKSDLKEFRNVKKLTNKVLQKELTYWSSLLSDFTNYINGSQYEVWIEGEGLYESYFANSLEELCDFIVPFLNKQVA